MNLSKLSKFLLFLVVFALFVTPANISNKQVYATGGELKISSKSAILVSFDGEEVLFEKNSEDKLPIASMTKLASLSVIFKVFDRGIIKENDLVCVSEKASRVGGSSAFLDAGSKYKVSDLIKSVILASANDSTVALAEFVAGSEELFVSKMNNLCVELGLTNTHFENSTGLPAENHYSTAKDLVKIYKTVCDNPMYKKYSKLWMEDFIHPSGRKTGLVNTNRLVKTFDGIDGGKTGYTDKARFCLTASATRGDTRFIAVVIGANDSKTRFSEASKLFNYGFANFENKLLVNKDAPVAVHEFKNAKNQSTIFPEKSLSKFLSKNSNFEFTTDYEIFELKAPINQGDVVGKMFIFDKDNMVVEEVNLVSGNSVEEKGFKELLGKVISIW